MCDVFSITMGDSQVCVIQQLLTNPFRLKRLDEKLEIVRCGRPCPELPNLKSSHKDKGHEYIRHFRVSQYNKTDWIAGSSTLNKLFCWLCLLFTKEQTVWSSVGYDNLNNLHNSISKHEKSKSHIFSLLQIKIFGVSRIDLQLDDQKRADDAQHNEMVMKKREILKRLIDTVCFLAIHELPFGATQRVKVLLTGVCILVQ